MLDIELRNYRAFSDEAPARWTIQDGFVSFVGMNNAGKSSLLRFFHEFRSTLNQIGPVVTGNFHNAFQNAEVVGLTSVADQQEVFCNANTRDMTIRLAAHTTSGPGGERVPEALILRVARGHPQPSYTAQFELGGQTLDVREWKGSNIVSDAGDGQELFSYLPYVEACAFLVDSVYLGPFRNAINVGTKSDYFDLQIGEAFIAQWDVNKTGGPKGEARAALAVEEEIRRIFGMRTFQLNATPGNQALQLIVDGEPYQLHEQGAGLAQFILVLAFVAVRRPQFVLIDEPELNLHPALQLDFLTTLSRYAKRGVVFATHSLGLARAASDEIYSVRRSADGHGHVRRLEDTPRLVEFIGELGFSGYREIGFNRVLLCEGRTDVKTLQRLLRHHGIEHEILLASLGGSSLIHEEGVEQVVELKRITDRISIVIDSERDSEEAELDAQRQLFVDGCRLAEIDVHVLDRRAIENYFSAAAVQAVKGPKYRALGPYEKLADAEPAWSKRENWKIASEMLPEDLAGTDLAAFLSQLTE